MHLDLRVVARHACVAGAPDVQGSHEGCRSEEQPFESSKYRGSFCSVADSAKADTITQEDGQRDEACEPENHGQGLGSQNAILVCGIGEARRRDDDVAEGENGPDGGEDEEVYFGRRILVPLAGPPVRDVCR